MQALVEQKVSQLVKELQYLFGEQLVSVCVYGSAVFGESLPRLKDKHQDINVLVLLHRLDVADLEKMSSVGKWWDKVGHSLPLVMSLEEWQRSADVFALEYADIRDNHVVAYGADHFSGIQVDRDALRLVCELELHRKLIFLQQRLLIHRDKPAILLELLQAHVNSVAALCRGVLRLHPDRQNLPFAPDAVFEAMTSVVKDLDVTPFLRVLRSKEPHTEIRSTDVFVVFTQFVAQLSAVTAYVDRYFGFVTPKEGACR